MELYVPLPEETEELLKRIIDIEQSPNVTKDIFAGIVGDLCGKMPHFEQSIATLKTHRYITNENKFELTDVGAGYFYLKRRHFLDNFLTPGYVALAVSLLVNFVVYFLFPWFKVIFDIPL